MPAPLLQQLMNGLEQLRARLDASFVNRQISVERVEVIP